MNMNKIQEGQRAKLGRRQRNITILIRIRTVTKKRIITISTGQRRIKERKLDPVILNLHHLLEVKIVQALVVIIITEVRLHLLLHLRHLRHFPHLRLIIRHPHHHDRQLPLVDLLRILLIRIQLRQVGRDLESNRRAELSLETTKHEQVDDMFKHVATTKRLDQIADWLCADYRLVFFSCWLNSTAHTLLIKRNHLTCLF